jgi:hypothetical protein
MSDPLESLLPGDNRHGTRQALDRGKCLDHGAPRTIAGLTALHYQAKVRTGMSWGSELDDPLGAQQYSDAGRPGRLF